MKDYKKLYEDIVKSEWFKKAYYDKSIGDCPFVIDELKESEDERIRKWIRALVTNQRKIAGELLGEAEAHRADTALAWLEKQKEQPTNEEMLRTLRAEYEKGVADTIAKYEQKEQKPALTPERIHPKFAVGDTVCRPMWSEHTIREIYVRCNDPVYVCVNDEGTESHISFSEQDKWERKEQKSAEWSEEDERVIQDAIALLTSEGHDEIVNRLVRLYPQPHWKPSEEQMDELELAIKAYESEYGCYDLSPLKSLFKQLKQL